MSSDPSTEARDSDVTLHAFYYGWYMNPDTDGQWAHWNHHVLLPDGSADTTRDPYPGGDDIGADFFPSLGAYSSSDAAIMQAHAEMLVAAGVDNVVLSWWGADAPDSDAARRFVDVLHEYELSFSIHVEPAYDDIEQFDGLLRDLDAEFGKHPALFRVGGLPMYFVYDSYRLAPDAWQRLLGADGPESLRGSSRDGLFIGLWVEEQAGADLVAGGFDGFYTYFAVDGFVYGSTLSNWPAMDAFAERQQLLFVPSVGPGYRDDRIRPWNSKNTRDREEGRYFDRMFTAAIETGAGHIAITSFNEWHEGTQIEPAVPKTIDGFTYDDYAPLPEDFFIKRTRFWKTVLDARDDE